MVWHAGILAAGLLLLGARAESQQRRRRRARTTTPEPDVDLPEMRPVPAELQGTKEEYLWIVDEFVRNQPRNPNGLLQTYGPGKLGGGDCKHCHLPILCPAKSAVLRGNRYCRHDTYDNALVAIYLTKRAEMATAAGRPEASERFADAKAILDSFIYLMYPPAPRKDCHTNVPSGRPFCLLAASYTIEGAKAGDYWPTAVTAAGNFVDTGNNAWVGMAFARYAAATGDACYAAVAHDLLAVMRTHRCEDAYGGFMGRMSPTNEFYRSIEHNIDVAAFARMLGSEEDLQSAQRFVGSMYTERSEYFHFDGAYVVGTKGRHRCNTDLNHGALPVDAQIWSMAAQADPNRTRETVAMGFAARLAGEDCVKHCNSPKVKGDGGWAVDTEQIGQDGEGVGDEYHGMRFSNAGSGIQWEITASGIVGMAAFEHKHGHGELDLRERLKAARGSIKKILKRYHAVPASTRGGDIQQWRIRQYTAPHPGGSDTGLGWTYLRYPHVASSVWSGLMLIQQADAADTFDAEGNPFAAPKRKVPPPEAGQCLRPGVLV